MCNVYGTPEEVTHKFAVLRRHCEELGRPYEAVTRTVNLWLRLARDEADRAAQRAALGRPDAPIDLPEQAIATLRTFEAAGMDYAIVKLLDGHDPALVRHFADTVMPAFPRAES